MSSKHIVHVAVAVIKNQHEQFLIAKRSENAHQGGLWEFPGGKLEDDESVLEALKRELFEELGITLIQATPLIQIPYDYGDKSVLLDVWCVDEFTGSAFGKEGQEILWVNESDFSTYDFPAANMPIITAIQLPDKYMITGDFKTEKELLLKIQSGLDKNIKLIQFRAYDLPEDVYFNYAKKIHILCKKESAQLILNTSVKKYKKHKAYDFSNGLHLNSKEMKSFSSVEWNEDILISTSTHNYEELLLAKKMYIDFVLLSPVNKTDSHPNSITLGWEKFKQLTEKATIPVYALGGMTTNDIKNAKINGAQGIAAIGEFWNV